MQSGNLKTSGERAIQQFFAMKKKIQRNILNLQNPCE